jgi:hypothetical protein
VEGRKMSRGIRRYGPGKFNTILDSVIYQMIGEGMGDESCGDVSEVGFYAEKIGLGPDAVKEAERIIDENGDGPLTDEERKMIEESVGAIMAENDQGFVTVDYYDKEKEFDKDWAEVEDDASGEDEEGEKEESEEEEAETEEAE